jgi:hypothetical protein
MAAHRTANALATAGGATLVSPARTSTATSAAGYSKGASTVSADSSSSLASSLNSQQQRRRSSSNTMSDVPPAYDSNQHTAQQQHQQQHQLQHQQQLQQLQQLQQQLHHHRRESSECDQHGFEASWASSSTAGADRSAELSTDVSAERPSPVHYSPDHSTAATTAAAAAEALTPSRNRHH